MRLGFVDSVITGSTIDFEWVYFEEVAGDLGLMKLAGGTMNFSRAHFLSGTDLNFGDVELSGAVLDFREAEFAGGIVDLDTLAILADPPLFDVWPGGVPDGLKLPSKSKLQSAPASADGDIPS
jgi:hypothetical protein